MALQFQSVAEREDGISGVRGNIEAARREKVPEQSIGRWKIEVFEAGKTVLAAGESGPSTREQQPDAVIRVQAGMPTSRFCTLNGVPERSYRRWQAKARQSRSSKGRPVATTS